MSDPSRPRADEDERDQANASLDVGQQQVEQQQDPEVDASVDTRKQQWNINEQKREEYKQKVIDADARRAATPNADIWERVADAGGGRHAQEQAQLAKQDEALLKDAVPQLEQNKLNRVKEAERINAAQDRQAAQARTKELRIFEAQGGETTVDPTTGEKTEALHPDGSFRSKPGAIEGQKPFIEEYRTSTDAAASILGGGTDTGVLGATGGEQAEGKLVQPTRNDRFETANVPIEKKTDPKTGEIYSETKDEFGNPTRVTFGQDQKIPRLNQIGQEIDTRDMELQALDVQRMQIEPGFKATETAYEELKKKREAKQPFIQVDGKWIERPDEEVPKDPKDRAAWLKTQYKAQPEKLAVYQRSRAMEEPAWQKASKEYEAARPQWENLQSTTDALKLKKEKAILTKKRVELDLPEEDGGIAATLTAADAGLPEGGFKPVLDAIREHGTTYQMATGLTGSGQGIEMGTVNSAESPQPGEGIPTDAEIEGTVTGARNAGEAPPQVPGTAPSVPLIPQDDPAKLKAFTSSFKGLANPEQFTLGAKGANYQYIQKDGLNIASLDTNRKNGHAFLLLNEADRSRFDLKGLINTEAKDGLPVYLAEREQQPDPLTEAKWASEVFVTIADIVNGTFAEGPGSNEAQHAKLKEMGADLPSLQKKVNSGEISVQTGGALMKELYGVSLTPAEYDSPQALQKYIEETTKKELAEGVKPELTTAAKWKEANTAENFSLSGKESVKNDYAADYILQNRHSPLLTRADQKALYAKNADTADVSFVDQLNSKLTATKKFAANSLIAPVVGIVVGIGRDAAQAVFSGSETALFGDSKGYKDLEASLALRYGGASANVYGMERNREKWFTLEGIQLAGNLDTALNAYRDIVDANEDTATPNKAAEDAARKQVIELGLAMHNLARNDDDPISEKDIDPHQDKALAMALVRYKGTADPRAWELLKDRLLMSNDRRRVSAEMEAKTKGMGEFMAALTMGSYADPIEIGSEALSVFTMGGYGALAKGGKAVNVALKGNSLYKASRVGKIATTLTDGLRKEALAFKALGTAKGTLEKPLTMGQKVGNAALTGGKGMALGGGSEAIEEVVVELGADSPDLIQAGAGGFFGGMLMLPVGLAQQKTGEAIATYQQQAQLKEGYHKYARDYNTLNADVPGFEPIDAATAELASLIINPQDRAVGTQAIAAEVSALQENIALQESAAAAGQPIDAALPAMRERLQTLETTSVMLAEMDIAAIDSVQRYASLSTEEKQTALAYAKVNAGRADLLTPQERKSIQGQTPNGVPMFAGDAFTPEGAAYLAEQFPEIAQAAAIAPGMAYDAATPGTQAAPAAAPDPAAREAIVSRLAQIDQELAATPEQADAPRDLSPEGIQQRPSAALEQDEIEYKDILRQTITDPEAQENAKLAQQGLNAIRAERQRRAQDPAFIEPTPAAAQPNEQHAALNTEKASLLKQLEEIDSTPQPPPPDGGGQRPNIQRVEIDEPTQARANTISQQVLDRVRSTSPALADKISLVEQHPTYTSGGVQMNFDPEAPINIVPGDVAQLIAASPDATDAEIVQSLTEIIETHEVTHYAQFEQSKAEAKARGLTGTDSENFFTIYNERATQYQSESPEAWTVASELYGRNSENKSDEFSGWTTLSPAAQAAEVERMFVESLISKNGTPTDANRLLGASNGTLKTRLLELAQWIGDLITGNLRDAQGNVVPIPESIKARAQEIAATVEAIRAGTPLNVTPSTTNTSSPNTANSQQQSTPSQTGNGTGTPPQGNGNSQPANNGGTQPPPGNNAGASPPAKEGKLNQYGVFELSLEDGTYSRSPDGKWFWPDGTPVKSNLTGELEPSYQKFIATPAPTPKTPAASPPAAKVTPLNLGQAVSISFEDGTTGPGKVVVINADGSYTVTEDGRPGSMNKTASQLAPINSPQQQADPRVAASKTVRSEFDKALTARPLFKKDAALMQGLKEAAFDVSESLQGRPEAEVKEAAARAIGAYLQSPEVSEKLGQIYAAESAKAKAYRSAAAARVNAEADRVIGQRMSTVRDLIGSIGRITRPTNALELSRTGQTLPPEWNGMLRVSDYSGGGKNAVARAIIGKIYAQDTDTGISPDKAASGLEAELPEKYQGMTPDMLWQAIEKEIRGYLQGADTSSLEDPDMDTSGMTDDQIDTMVEKANKAATVEKWKGITGKAILDSTATAYETEYQKIVAEEGENSFLDDDYIERARATVDARLEAEAEAKRPKPKERSPTVEDDGSIFAAIDNGGQLQTDPTPSIKDRIKRWVSAMPGFQGGKAEMAGPVTQAVEEAMTPAQRDHFTTAVDYFGGGGSWAIFNALTSFKNIRNLIVYERNADRVEKIRLFHTKGNMVAEMLKNPTIVEALNNAASKARADGVPSGSAIARRININGISDPLVLGLKQAITDYLENSFGTKADEDGNITPEAKVAMAIRIVSQEAAAVYAAVTEFNKRGGTIEYRNNNSYEAMPEADSRTLAFVDPPYFLTKGYSYDEVADDLHDGQYKESITETTVGADTYGDTAALLKRLSDAGNGIIYTDSAWWKTIPKETDNSPSNAKRIKKAVGNVDGVPMMDMEIEQAEKNKASSYFGLTPDQRRLFHPEGRRILSDISSTLDRFDVVSGEIGAKRKEVLGIHYGNQPTTNTGRGARPQRLLDRPKNQGTPDGRVSTSERGGNPAQQTVPGMAGRITAEDGASRSESSDPLNDARLGSAAPQPSRSTSALQDVIAYNPGGRFGDGSPAAVEKALVAWAVNDQANKGPHVVRIVPVADITPSQTGEDYLNDSSRETARRISSGEVVDSRWQDAMPIIVDKDGNILNGNHRHASATINGDQTIPAVVPADSRLAQNPALFSPAAQAKEWTPKEIAALEEKVAHLKITGRPITPKNAFGDWAASPEDAGIIYGYRGESAPGAFTYPPTDNNNGSSEGVGLYIAKDSRDSEIFGKPRRVPFPEPKRPLIVDNDNGDPLPLLQEDEAAWERILSHKTEKGDSDWIKAHTLAAKQIGLTDETWQEKIDQFPRALTDVMLNMGYDAVYTRSAGMEWVTILAKPNQRFNRGTKSAGGTALYSPAPQAAPAAQYRYLKDKEAKAGLTPAEQQALLQSEKAMGQSFAIDMDDPALQARKGSVSPSFQPQLKLETQHPVTGKQLALFSPAAQPIDPETPVEVVDTQTGKVVWQGVYAKRHIARKVQDRRDAQYGGYRYRVRIGQSPSSQSALGSAAAQPIDDTPALDAALKGMDPIYRKVFQASQRATTPTPQELAAEFSLPERAIVNIIGTARTRIQAHGRTIRPGGLQPAKTADGKLKGGMPSRANSTTPALAAVDQIQQQEGLPLGTPDHEIIAAATKISSRPDAEQVIAASFSAGERSPAMVAATHQFLLEAGIKGLQSPTITEIALQYRAEGTAWADAGRARKDPHLTPAERNALIFQELFTSPNKGVQKAWREAKTPEQKQAILQEWNARVKGIKESLKARGLDLQEAMDRLAAQRNDAAAAEQEASQAHQKLVDRLQNDVTRLQAELAAAQDQAAKDVAQAKLDKATEQAAEAKALDPSNTIRLELEKLNRLERAAIEELRDGGTWQTAASVSFLSVADVKRVFDKFADALDDAGMRAILLAEDILLDQQARLGAPAANAMTREERAKQAAAGIRKALGYDSALIDRRSKGITPKPKKGKAQKQPAAAKPEPADMTDEQFQAYLDNPQTWRPAWQGEMAITGENTSFDQWINKPETRARKTRLTRMSKQPVSTTTGELDMHDPLSVKRAFDEFNIHNASLFDKAVSIWRMGILSGLHTGIINFTGNVAHSQYNLWPRRLMEAGVNNALSMLGLGSKEAATFGELKYMAQAQHKAMSRAGTAMVTSWNMDSRIVESEVLALGAQLEFSGIGADYIPKSVGGPLGKLLHSISFRHMTAADEMIKAYHAQTEVMAQAYRIAKNENLTGEAFDKRMDELLEYGSPAWKKAMDSATWVTFQNEVDPKNQRSLAIFDRVAYGLRHLSQTDTGRTKEITNAKGKKVTVAITKPNVFAFFFPFINTPLNIMKIGIEMSPIGAFFSIVDAARALKIRIKDKNISPERSRIAAAELYDRLRLVQDLTNQIIGMGMFYALGSLVKPGDEDDLPWITGSTDWKSTSKGDRDLRARVMPAYTVRVPFTDAMLTYQRIEPFGTALGFIVDARIAVNKKGFSDEALGEFMASAINQFNDKTFMKGLSDLMSLWNDPERIGTRLTSSIVTGFIPNLIRQPIREADPYLRDTKPGADIGFVEGVWHNIKYSLAPGYAPIAQDVWGNPLKRHPGMQVGNVHTDILLRVFDPTNLTVRDQIDPLDLYLFNWNNTAATPKERFNIEPIQKNLQIDRHGKTHTVTLTPEEHAQANRNAGKAAREMLGNDWDASNPQAQEVERVKEVLQKYQKRERDQLRDKYRSTLPQE